MERTDQAYYENYFEMFATKGWRQFMKDMKEGQEEARNKAFNGGEERFLAIKGEIEVSSRLLSFESRLRSTYDHEQEDEQELEEDFKE